MAVGLSNQQLQSVPFQSARLRPSERCMCRAAAQPTIVDRQPPYWAGKTNVLSKLINMAISNPAIWAVMRAGARQQMTKTAERSGIPWATSVNNLKNTPELLEIKQELESANIAYPDYYLKDFHAYDGGNLDWKAAFEIESATSSLSMRVFKDDKITPETADQQFRGSFLDATQSYCERQGVTVHHAVDVACSSGVSTRWLADRFPQAKIQGLDLSPHFLAVAELRRRQADQDSPAASTSYVHANAEAMPLDDRHQDMVASSYLVHELPAHATHGFLKEAHRVLKPGGVLAIVDGDPWSEVHQKMPLPIATLMKSTEPWADEYFSLDLEEAMREAGFGNIEYVPVNKRHRVMLGVASSS